MIRLRSPLVAVVLVAALGPALGCSHAAPRPKASRNAEPRPLPEATITALGGGSKALSEVVRGKVAVIDLWASWCTACRPVSARVATLAEAHSDDPSLVVLGLNEGEDAPAVTQFLAGKTLPHPTYLDPTFAFADALGARELPAVVVVDREGRVISVTRKLDAAVVRLVEDELAQTH